MRPFFLSNELWIEHSDAASMKEGVEVTLMQWGNALITKIHRDAASGQVTLVEGESRPDGNVKSTELKICFVAKSPDCVPVDMVAFDFLITKAKMEDEDDLDAVLTSNDHPTRQVTRMIGEPALRTVTEHQIVQIMRRGMTRCDKPLPAPGVGAGAHDSSDAAALQLFIIPDGKQEAMSAMASSSEAIARRI
jgi:glutamyl-tRNA synthetase